jgi:putative FmdB family regulatory protein
MPIYEYQCAKCGFVSALVVLSSRSSDKPTCQNCRSTRLRRVMSTFAVVESEASRLASFDTSRTPRDESFYKDSRNVGLWAKKRAQEMGVDLGSKFDETVEKARSGQLIKDML